MATHSTCTRVTVRDEHVGPDDKVGPCQVTVTFDADGSVEECPEACSQCGGVLDDIDQDRIIAAAAVQLFERRAEGRRYA